MIKRILTLSLILVVILSFSACAKEAENGTGLSTNQTSVSGEAIVKVELGDGEIWVGSPPEGKYSSLNFEVTNVGSTQHQFVLLYAWDSSPENLPVENNQVRYYSYFDEDDLRMWFFLAWPGPVKVSRGSQAQYKELGPILDPGETTIVNVPFGKPTSNLIIFCNLPGHYESGEYTVYNQEEQEINETTTAVISTPITDQVQQTVTFTDSNLEAAIRSMLSKPEGPIYISDLETITTLKAEWRYISDLTGLEYCTNLREIRIGDNNINDLSPLSGLIKLELLYIWSNPISDISPLTNLVNLQQLNFVGNNVSDLSPLSGLINLISLGAGQNDIDDISPLAGLDKIEDLNLLSNDISDISPLANLTNLKYLDLFNNNISDISPLAGLDKLSWLNLGENNISDIAPLVGNIGLSSIGLFNNPLNATSINQYIPQLIARGVIIEY